MEYPIFSDEDREETILERRKRETDETVQGAAKAENEESIPLIPNIKQDQRKVIVKLNVKKVNPPDDGFKGSVSPTTDYETLAKLYGDGLYDIEAVTAEGKVLRRSTIKLAWTNPDAPKVAAIESKPGNPETDLLKWQAEQHARETQRVESFGKMTIEATREASREHNSALTKMQEQQTTRDREFFQGMMAQQQTWAERMLERSEQSHQQSIERAQQAHTHLLETMRLSHERELQTSNPRAQLDVFKEALSLYSMMGGGAQGDDDDEDEGAPWAHAIDAAADAISDITSTVKLRAFQESKKTKALPEPKPKTKIQPATEPPKEIAKPEREEKQKRKSPLSKRELIGILELKALAAQKGFAFRDLLAYAQAQLAGTGESEAGADDSADETPGDASGDAPEPAPVDVGD